MNLFARAVAALVSVALLFMSGPALAQQAAAATITGQVLDQRNALPVVGAAVVLSRAGTQVSRTTTRADGRYTINGVEPGVYDVTISASGYSSALNTDIAVVGTGSVAINATLIPSQTSNGSNLSSIGRTQTSARNSLASATTISQDVSVENLVRTGQIRATEQLMTLPALNINTSSSVGDDAYANIRGFGPSETQVLLDGHPVGPLGVLPRGGGGFNLGNTPGIGLTNINVTYGSGAQGLYGSDTVGGSINFETLAPTQRPQTSFQQQIGGFGKSTTSLTATGSFGRLGYALATGVIGSYGDFAPGEYFQGARPSNVAGNSVNPPGACNNANGNDVSLCNQGASTYALSQNTKLTAEFAKLRYNFSPVTSLTGTFYDSLQWADSTGNGDNDFLPYNTRLAQIQASPSTCTTGSGAAGYTVVTDPTPAVPVTACYTAQQFAAASSGGQGGGAGRQRSTSMRDYHLRFNTLVGNVHNITVDGFVNNYDYWKDSSLAGGFDANGLRLGLPVFLNRYETKGFLIADDIYGSRNDFGFGYYVQHQDQTGNRLNGNLQFVNLTPAYLGEGSAFVRDTYRVSDQLSLFANAWFKRSNVTQKTTFDPRVTALLRPTRDDVLRFTYGRSDGAPSPNLKLVGQADAVNPGASLTTVSCGGLNNVTTAGNPHLQSESANDFEFGYGHRFKGDSAINVNAYVTSMANQLFTASQPLLAYGVGNVFFEPGTLALYEARLNSQCGLNLNDQTVLPYLSVATTYNAAHALARGLEVTGRARFNRIAYIDYAYSIEEAYESGLGPDVLSKNPTLINGGQLLGIPLHQATVSLDIAPGPWEFRIDNYYVEQNNPFNRPSYWHSNAFLSRSFDRGRTVLTVGGTNIFNNAVDVFGRFGYGTYAAENAFFNDANAMQEYVNGNFSAERFGLAPATLVVTLSHRI